MTEVPQERDATAAVTGGMGSEGSEVKVHSMSSQYSQTRTDTIIRISYYVKLSCNKVLVF